MYIFSVLYSLFYNKAWIIQVPEYRDIVEYSVIIVFKIVLYALSVIRI